MTGTGQSATAVTEAWRRTISARCRARPGRPSTAADRRRSGRRRRRCPAMATRSSPTEKCGPRAATTTARTAGSAPMAAMATGRSSQKAGPMALRFSGRSSHRVATWPSTSMARTSDEKESMVGALMGAQRRAQCRRPPVPPAPAAVDGPAGATGRPVGPVVWRPRLVDRASIRERSRSCPRSPPTSPPPCPAPPGCTPPRARPPRPSPSSPLPTEKDEVWRYSRIDQLDLDRFRPAGTSAPGDDPGPSPSERIHALVDGLGPRQRAGGHHQRRAGHPGLHVDDDLLSLGRAGDHADGEALLGIGARRPARLPAPQRRLRRRPGGRRRAPRRGRRRPGRRRPRGHRGGRRRRVPPHRGARRGRVAPPAWSSSWSTPTAACWPTAHDRAGPPDRGRRPSGWSCRSPSCRSATTPRSPTCRSSRSGRPPGSWPTRPAPSAPDATLSSYAVALGGGYARLRTDSALVGESGASRLRAAFIGRDDQMLDFRTLQDHRAPRTTSDLLFMGAVAETVPLGLQRAHPGPPGRGQVRRRADQPQPGARRGGPRRLGARTSTSRRTT